MEIKIGTQFTNDLSKAVQILTGQGLTLEMINLPKLEKDILWWEDVELACMFYLDAA